MPKNDLLDNFDENIESTVGESTQKIMINCFNGFMNNFTFIFFLFADITEVQFALEPHEKEKDPLSSNEYAVIAITSFCLGLMYIASVFLYIYLKKKKEQPSAANSDDLNKNFSREGKELDTVLIRVFEFRTG